MRGGRPERIDKQYWHNDDRREYKENTHQEQVVFACPAYARAGLAVQSQILRVRSECEIEQIAHQRNGAYRRVDSDIREHAENSNSGNSRTVSVNDDRGGHQPGDYITGPRD